MHQLFGEIMQYQIHIGRVMFQSYKPNFAKEEYLQAVEKLQAHIQRGDIYEVNFCQEYFVEEVTLNPLQHSMIYMLSRNLLLLVIIVIKIII